MSFACPYFLDDSVNPQKCPVSNSVHPLTSKCAAKPNFYFSLPLSILYQTRLKIYSSCSLVYDDDDDDDDGVDDDDHDNGVDLKLALARTSLLQ